MLNFYFIFETTYTFLYFLDDDPQFAFFSLAFYHSCQNSGGVMPDELLGICPNCDTERGKVGDPCPSPACAKKGYHFVPEPWLRYSKELAARRGRPVDPMLGRYVDRYLLIGKIGEGGMGAVFVARQRPLGREVAVKLVSGMEITQTALARFEREAKVVSVLDHPNIVKLFDYGVADLGFKVPYMAMEFVRHGKTLRQALNQIKNQSGGVISGDVIYAVFSQILNALQAAHNLGIIHRDIKPENIMIAPVQGNPYFVKILDFGLAKAVGDVTGIDGTISHTGQFLGTPFYMAPEQAPRSGRPVVDHRADLYSVGVMLFEIFTGVRPFEGETALACTLKKVDPSYDPFSLPQAQVLPLSLKSFLQKALKPRPEDRFESAEAMLMAFRDTIEGKKTTGRGLVGGLGTGSSEERPKTPSTPSGQGASVQAVQVKEETVTQDRQPPEVEAMETESQVLFPKEKSRKTLVISSILALVLAGAVVSGAYFFFGKGKPSENIEGGAEVQQKVAVVPTTPEMPAKKDEKISIPQKTPENPDTAKATEPERATQAKTVAEPKTIKVKFESTPSGAKVFEKGEPLGSTPFEKVFPETVGEREFVFKLDGWQDEKVVKSIRDGVVSAKLKKKPRAGDKGKKPPGWTVPRKDRPQGI
jgi:serine/threonine-protein kinase